MDLLDPTFFFFVFRFFSGFLCFFLSFLAFFVFPCFGGFFFANLLIINDFFNVRIKQKEKRKNNSKGRRPQARRRARQGQHDAEALEAIWIGEGEEEAGKKRRRPPPSPVSQLHGRRKDASEFSLVQAHVALSWQPLRLGSVSEPKMFGSSSSNALMLTSFLGLV